MMKGIVLCGGKSSRMGTDKALITHKGKTCLENTMALFDALSLAYVVSCNAQQHLSYTHFVPSEKIVIDQNKYAGPMRGLMSCYENYPQDLFLLACDMPDIYIPHLQALIDLYENDPYYDAYLYRKHSFYEPLCAIYTQKGLEKIRYKIDPYEGNFSFQKLLQKELRTKTISLTDAEASFLKNYNYKEDWAL